MLLQLPPDILISTLQYLSRVDLATLERTCRVLYVLVDEYGWRDYLRRNPRPSLSLAKVRQTWSARATAAFDHSTDASWTRTEFIARPISEPWTGKQQPLLALSSERLIVAAGASLSAYKFTNDATIAFERSCSLGRSPVTAMDLFPDGTICAGFHDGSFELIRSSDASTIERSPVPVLQLSNKDFLESLSVHNQTLVSLSSIGRVSLITTSEIDSPATLDLNARSWASYLSMDASTPFAAFGTSSATPLAIHTITPTSISPQPLTTLSLASSPTRSLSAVYGIARGPPSSAWGASPNVLVAGWYNGSVSMHDLRVPLYSDSNLHSQESPLRPVLTLSNAWSDSPIYSVASGGGSGQHIAAGAARHSLVSLWDLRSPTGGFSVHAPFNDRSPVYSLILESSRLFGATESRPFVLDFGPGVSATTYPVVQAPPGPNRQPSSKSPSIGFYVTKYNHRALTTRLAIA
ncbi:F-box domain-containing protein [Mycena kentingensis (nom. inval.)]|nr:F-box domain-containing protein [Mycena kentingensis (nom. inval.)]